jgi:hypothetical protein
LRDIRGAAPECLDVAQFIADRTRTFVDDVPAALRPQFDRLTTYRLVKIATDGFIFRGHGSRIGRHEGRTREAISA